MKETYLYHAICISEGEKLFYDQEKSMKILEEILKDGYLLSRRIKDKDNEDSVNFSGLDYISFCDRKLRREKPYQNNPFLREYTAYKNYIGNSLSLGFDRKRLEIINTKLVKPFGLEAVPSKAIREYGLSEERYSDMPDEVQIKDRVSLGNLKCLTLPVHLMSSKHSGVVYDGNEICRCINEIECLMRKYGYLVPIYDLYSKELLNSEEQVQKIMKKYRMR